MTRAVKLQINQRGAWRNALSFDQDAVDVEAIQVPATPCESKPAKPRSSPRAKR